MEITNNVWLWISYIIAGINPLKILGMSHDALVFLIEQLYGAKNCHEYKFKYHQYYDAELEEVRTELSKR